MRTEDVFDVVIVGAGAAGCAVAASLAHGGLSVAMVEGRGIGKGSRTVLTFKEVVDRFDLAGALRHTYRRIAYHSPLGPLSIQEADRPLWASVDYPTALRMLWSRASGTELFEEFATSLGRDREGVVVGTESGRRLRAKVLVDSSGAGGFSRRFLGLPRARHFSHSLGMRLWDVEVDDEDLLYLIAPSREISNGGGWLYPLGKGGVSLGVAAVTGSPHLPARRLRDSWRRVKRELRPYSDMVSGAKPGPLEVGTIPLVMPRRFVFDGILLVGDSAAQATPWSCFGFHAALLNGSGAGQAILGTLDAGLVGGRGLRSYEEQWRRQNGRVYEFADRCAGRIWERSGEVWAKEVEDFGALTPEDALSRLRYGPVAEILTRPWWQSLIPRVKLSAYVLRCQLDDALGQRAHPGDLQGGSDGR